LIFLRSNAAKRAVSAQVSGRLLDVGCGDQPIRRWLSEDIDYVGLDYPGTIALGYSGEAAVYADARSLPFAQQSFDSVIMLDVLEHLPQPIAAFGEMTRVARPGATLIVQVPFLYPIHDAPHDYHRWTDNGLRALAQEHGVEVVRIESHGQPVETGALMAALAIAKGLVDIIEEGRVTPAVFLLPAMALLVPIVNLLGLLGAKILPKSPFMPFGYTAIMRKP
jgi:SAM-dependent methyltransferase